jgi:hypothetical protein
VCSTKPYKNVNKKPIKEEKTILDLGPRNKLSEIEFFPNANDYN